MSFLLTEKAAEEAFEDAAFDFRTTVDVLCSSLSEALKDTDFYTVNRVGFESWVPGSFPTASTASWGNRPVDFLSILLQTSITGKGGFRPAWAELHDRNNPPKKILYGPFDKSLFEYFQASIRSKTLEQKKARKWVVAKAKGFKDDRYIRVPIRQG